MCHWSANTLVIALVITLVIDVIKELLILILTKIIHVFLMKSYNGIFDSDEMFISVCVCVCCEGGIKRDGGWFCWLKEVCWA